MAPEHTALDVFKPRPWLIKAVAKTKQNESKKMARITTQFRSAQNLLLFSITSSYTIE